MRIRPQICFAADGGGGGGDSGGSPTPSAPASGNGTPSAGSAPSSQPSAAPGSDPAPPQSPTPSPKPAAPTPTPGAAPPSGTPSVPEPFEFGDMESWETESPVPESPPPAQAEPPAQPAQATPPGAEPAAQPPAREQPGEQPPAPTGPQETPSPQSFPTEPLEVAQGLVQHEEALINHLAETEFKLSQQDLEALESDAPSHIPKLLARGYFKAQVNLMNQIGRLVPQMVQKQMQVMRRNMENENRFYSRWPEIDRVKHAPLLKRYATVYRQANPQATIDQMIEDVGPMVMMAAKVPARAQGAPGAAPTGNGARPPQPTPFVPALGGPAAPPAAVEEDPWAGMHQPSAEEG